MDRRDEVEEDAHRESVIWRLHSGAGIRRGELRSFLGDDLRRRWGVAKDASPARVREIVLLRVKAVLDEFADPHLEEIVWTAYNVGVAAPFAAQGLLARFDSLTAGRTGPSRSTCQRRFRTFVKRLAESLDKPSPNLGENQLRQAGEWLAANVRPSPRKSETYAAIRAMHAPPGAAAIRTFLDNRSYGPLSETGRLLAARLGKRGDWLCVFTDTALLTEYQMASRAEWPRIGHFAGREIVRDAYNRPERTGILVNPSPRRGSGIHATLPLPPDVIDALVAGR